MYPDKSIFLKLDLSPCNVHNISRDAKSQDPLVVYNIDEGKKMSLNFTNYTFNHSECELDDKTQLEFILTPFRMERGAVGKTSPNDYLKTIENGHGPNFSTVPEFVKFFRDNNTFEIESSCYYDHGHYQLWMQYEIYNPYSEKIIRGNELVLFLVAEATQPEVPKFLIYDEDGNQIEEFQT